MIVLLDRLPDHSRQPKMPKSAALGALILLLLDATGAYHREVARLADGNGLHLQIDTSGRKLWRVRFRFGGKANMMSANRFGVCAAGLWSSSI